MEGVIPYSDWVDVVGPIARTITDATKSMNALVSSSDDLSTGSVAQS